MIGARGWTERMRRGSFAHSVMVLLTGTTIAQGIALLASPVIARLYGPEQMGTYALFNAIVLVLSVPSSGLYEIAVVLPESDEEAVNVMGAAMLMTIGSAFVVLVVSFVCGRFLAERMGNPAIGAWLPLAALSILLINAYQILSYWTNRKQQYRRLSVSRVSRSLAISGTNVLLGVFRTGAAGLVAGTIVGQGAGAATLAWQVLREEHPSLAVLSWGRIRAAAVRYREFALFAAPTSLLNSAAAQAPIFFLTHSFDPATTGQFSLAAMIISGPSALLATSVQQVYYQRVALLQNSQPERLRAYLLRTAGYMTAIALIPLLILVTIGPSVFAIVFGEQWRAAGEYARIVAFASAINFVVAPVSSLLSVSGNIKVASAWKCVYFCTTVIVLSIASRYSVQTFLIIYAVHQVVLYAVYFGLILRAATRVVVGASIAP